MAGSQFSISLTDLASLSDETSAIASINSNFQTLEDALNNMYVKFLRQSSGSSSAVVDTIDMNSNTIINLPDATLSTSPVTLSQFQSTLQGRSVLNGSGAPSDVDDGIDGDFYIDTDTFEIYGPKASSTWGSGTPLSGEAVLNGSGAPSVSTGVDGDFYIDTSASDIYGPKTAGTWGSGTSLIGPTGSTGATGATGATGLGGKFIVFASTSSALDTSGSGDQWSFGDGAKELVFPVAVEVTGLLLNTTGSTTATVELYSDGSSTGHTVSTAAGTNGTATGFTESFSASGRLSFRTTAGTSQGTAGTVGVVCQINTDTLLHIQEFDQSNMGYFSFDVGDNVPLLLAQDSTILLGVNASGYLIGKTVEFQTMKEGATNAAIYSDEAGQNLYPIWIDIENRVVCGFDTTQKKFVGTFVDQVEGVRGYDRVALETAITSADWYNLAFHGQSNGMANGDNTPVISSSQPYSNLTFNGGVDGSSRTSSIAMVEASGESPVSSAGNMITALRQQDGSGTETSSVIFGHYANQSGTAIANLDKPGAGSWDFIDRQDDALTVATNASKSINIPFYRVGTWRTGQPGVDDTSFLQSLFTTMKTDMDTDLSSSGYTGASYLLVVPNCSYVTNNDGPVLAMNEAVEENSDIVFCTPFYHLPHANIHLNNVGCNLLGKYIGRACKQILDGYVPDCIWPLSAYTLSGSTDTIYVKLQVPRLPLVIDDFELPSVTDYGFKVTDDTGTLTISSITVVDSDKRGDTIKIVVNRALDTNPKVRYALDAANSRGNYVSAGAGNVRDSTIDKVVVSGVTYNLWHVSPAYEKDIVTLEGITH